MRVCDCVTQSSSNDIDEEMAHLSGSRERTERRKNMTKKMKVRVSALIMCAAMLVSAMSVWAVSDSTTVNLDNTTNGYASIYLSDIGYSAEANTSGQSLYNDILLTQITGYTSSTSRTVSGGTRAEVTLGNMTSASSYHKWTARTCTLTVYR